MKRCSKCLEEKPILAFHTKKTGRDGHSAYCKKCAATMCAEYRAANADRMKAQAAAMRAANRARLAEQSREYARANAESVRARNRAYYHANKERRSAENRAWRAAQSERLREYAASPKGRAKTAARRAARSQATVAWADKAAIAAFYAKAVQLTLDTGIPHEVDHIVPLRSKVVCGLHVHTNLQILTEEQNIMKRNKFEAGV